VKLADQMDFWKFLQYMFFKQWRALKKYATAKGIRIIGDIPIYVAPDSADVWAHPKNFLLDGKLSPKAVAGVPPDDYAPEGQLWGNPLYNWAHMKKDSFSWWRERIRFSAKLYDVIRIDHFIGICRYYAVPNGAEDAAGGKYCPGPGMELIEAIDQARGKTRIIAEDLGILGDDVEELLGKTRYPGMNVIQFAFGSDRKNKYLPKNYKRNSVAYTSTHDSPTLKGFLKNATKPEKAMMKKYFGFTPKARDIIDAVTESRSKTVVVPLCDYLGLGNEARVNTPSTTEDNWCFRYTADMMKKFRRQAARLFSS